MNRLVVALCVLVPAVASANAKTDAQAKINAASKFYEQGKLADALQALKDAYVLDPRPELLFAIGQTHVGLGQCSEAIVYYQRYLATKPPRNEAAITREAIKTCKTNPGKVEPVKPPPDEHVDTHEDTHEVAPPPPPPPPPPAREIESRSWYTDVVGDGLLVAGIAVGVGGAVMYSVARSARDDADIATTNQRYVDRLDDAKRDRTYAIVLGGTGAALVLAGVIRFAVHDRTVDHAIAFVPTTSGGLVTWTWQR